MPFWVDPVERAKFDRDHTWVEPRFTGKSGTRFTVSLDAPPPKSLQRLTRPFLPLCEGWIRRSENGGTVITGFMRPRLIEALTIAIAMLMWAKGFAMTLNPFAFVILAVMIIYFGDAFSGTYKVLRGVLTHETPTE